MSKIIQVRNAETKGLMGYVVDYDTQNYQAIITTDIEDAYESNGKGLNNLVEFLRKANQGMLFQVVGMKI